MCRIYLRDLRDPPSSVPTALLIISRPFSPSAPVPGSPGVPRLLSLRRSFAPYPEVSGDEREVVQTFKDIKPMTIVSIFGWSDMAYMDALSLCSRDHLSGHACFRRGDCGSLHLYVKITTRSLENPSLPLHGFLLSTVLTCGSGLAYH